LGSAEHGVQAHLAIHGLVQGVFFRARLKERADAAGVAGWVRNLSDGSVEAILAGPPSAVEEVIAWAQVGPAGARVASVDVRWNENPANPIPQGFEVR
jgi:acylphosphatase